MPRLFPGTSNKDDLKLCHLILAVVDYDITNDDDLLGVVIFPLATLMVSHIFIVIFFIVIFIKQYLIVFVAGKNNEGGNL
jgi:hypothetical protein